MRYISIAAYSIAGKSETFFWFPFGFAVEESIGDNYLNVNACKDFIPAIAEVVKRKIQTEIKEYPFVSLQRWQMAA